MEPFSPEILIMLSSFVQVVKDILVFFVAHFQKMLPNPKRFILTVLISSGVSWIHIKPIILVQFFSR